MTDKIKTHGVIYTPENIVKQMIVLSNPTPDMTIMEPSCGDGAFIFGLLHYMEETFNLKNHDLANWLITKVYGIEIDKDIVKKLKKELSIFFEKRFNIQINEKKFTHIVCMDSLLFDKKIIFDLCIGNPPYVRTHNLDNQYLLDLRNTYISCKTGAIDLYFAFIEKYMKISKRLCFITPNSFLTNSSGKTIKNLIKNNLSLLIDFKEKHIFPDASVYTCIFKIEYIKTIDFLYGTSLSNLTTTKIDTFFSVPTKSVSTINVLSGIATLCDGVYRVVKKDKKFYASYNNISYEVEKKLVVPCLKLTKIKSDLSNIEYIIYPYKDKKCLLEKEIQQKYPLAYKYLLAIKIRLEQRDKGKTNKYEAWYAYGRKQGLHNIKENNLIVVPQLIGGSCKPIKIDVSSILKEFNTFVFTSGYIITDSSSELGEAFLTPLFITFVKSIGKPWPGNPEPYYGITIKDVKKFSL